MSRLWDAAFSRCQVCNQRGSVKGAYRSWCDTCWAEAHQVRWLERNVGPLDGVGGYQADDLMEEWVRCRRALLEYQVREVVNE
jgi:hypothetical protein